MLETYDGKTCISNEKVSSEKELDYQVKENLEVFEKFKIAHDI